MPVSGVNPIQDIAQSKPVLGIPVIGQLLNVPNEIASNLALDVTDPNSPIVGTAQQEGAQASFAQRPDISPLGKTALDLGTSFLTPGFGFAGPAGDITAGVTRPAVQTIQKVFQAIPNIPVLGKLFDLSPNGMVQQMTDNLGTALGRVNRNGVNPSQFQQVMDQYYQGAITAEQAKDTLGVGQITFNSLAQAYPTISPQSVMVDSTDPAAWYKAYGQAAINQFRTSIGAPAGKTASILPPPVQGALNTANTVSRELQLSTGHVAGVVMVDQGGKALVNNLVQDLPGDVVDLAQNRATSGMIQPLRNFYGAGATVDNSLHKAGQVNAVSGLLGLDTHQGILNQATPAQSAIGGAALGALTGNPIGIALGAAQGLLTKAGLGVNENLTQFADTVIRQRFIADGITKYFENDPMILETFQPTLRDQGLQQVQQLAGPAAPQLFSDLQAKNFWVDAKTVGAEAQQLGVSPENAKQITHVWTDLADEAETAAISFMKESNLIFNRDTNLLSYVRNVTPFPIWPFQNAPYYFKTAVRYPGVASAITDYFGNQRQNQQDQNLTQKVNNRIPILTIGNQTIYANPLNFLSAASQFGEQYQPPSSQPQTGLDQAIGVGQQLGFMPFLYQQALAQATGLAGQGQDLPTISPFSRLTNAVGTALTGQPFNIESGVTAPLNAVRQTVAPQSVPGQSYAEYQVRQQLADMSLQQTGQPWYKNPDYEMAMVNPQDPLYQQAARTVGVNNAILFPFRRYVPFQVTSVGQTEQDIRNQQGQVNQAVQGSNLPTSTQFSIRDLFPTSEGYQWIGEPTPELILQLKQQTYYDLPKQSQPIYLQQNPDLSGFLNWSAQQKQQGSKTTKVADYYQKVLQHS